MDVLSFLLSIQINDRHGGSVLSHFSQYIVYILTKSTEKSKCKIPPWGTFFRFLGRVCKIQRNAQYLARLPERAAAESAAAAPKEGLFPGFSPNPGRKKRRRTGGFSLRPAGSAAPGGVRRGRSLHKLLDGTVELVNGSPVLGAHGVHNAVLQVVLEDDLARIVQGAAHR